MRALPAVLLSCLFALPAAAAFKVCNKTSRETKVALGLFDGTAWTSRGWWAVAPDSCAVLVSEPLDARYYYLYATDDGVGVWYGKTVFCVSATTFHIKGRADCEAHGYDRKGFFEVDTGQAPDYTQTLSD